MLELFWTPAPDSPEIRAAVRAYTGRWHDVLFARTHTPQTAVGAPLMLAAMTTGCAALSAALPLDRGVGLAAVWPMLVGVVLVSVLCAVLMIVASRIQTRFARAVQYGALVLLLMLLAASGMAMIWSTFGRGAVAPTILALNGAVLMLGFVTVFQSWRPRLVAALVDVPFAQSRVSGASVLAAAVMSVVFVVGKWLFASGSDAAADIASALICAGACNVIAWLFSHSALPVARLLIALDVLR
jgi:hypothetical protein